MNTITAALSRGKFGLQSSRMTCARLTAKLYENYGLLHYEKDKTCIQANLKMLGKGTRNSKPLVRKNGLTAKRIELEQRKPEYEYPKQI